jgi:endoglycosylceramidase
MKLQKDLFTNQRGLLDSFVRFWETVAAYMSEEPNLLGYEFINEPLGYDVYLNPADSLLPGAVNDKYLLPAYRRIYQAIRKNDRRALLFFEPSTVDIFGGSFFETPGGDQELDRQVFSYHVYCPYVSKLGEPVSPAVCQGFDTLEVESKEQNIRKLKTGGFMTEYGALSGT